MTKYTKHNIKKKWHSWLTGAVLICVGALCFQLLLTVFPRATLRVRASDNDRQVLCRLYRREQQPISQDYEEMLFLTYRFTPLATGPSRKCTGCATLGRTNSCLQHREDRFSHPTHLQRKRFLTGQQESISTAQGIFVQRSSLLSKYKFGFG